jgi:beta-aspartyl-peptidase (threonine type)
MGNLVAGTSTGGMTGKRWGRIGDAPVIGAGTYANNASCAVSATGHGEYFIRHTVARDVCARMELAGETLSQAADEVVNKTLVKAGGDGGIIAVDANGNVALTFNTPGMYRASINASGEKVVGIFGDD